MRTPVVACSPWWVVDYGTVPRVRACATCRPCPARPPFGHGNGHETSDVFARLWRLHGARARACNLDTRGACELLPPCREARSRGRRRGQADAELLIGALSAFEEARADLASRPMRLDIARQLERIYNDRRERVRPRPKAKRKPTAAEARADDDQRRRLISGALAEWLPEAEDADVDLVDLNDAEIRARGGPRQAAMHSVAMLFDMGRQKGTAFSPKLSQGGVLRHWARTSPPANDRSEARPAIFGLPPNAKATIDFLVRSLGGPRGATAIILNASRRRVRRVLAKRSQ